MKLVRFMSENELQKYMRGERLENRTDWRKAGWDSGSRGFCFFGDEVEPEERLSYAAGIVDISAVAEFEPLPFVRLEMTESVGTYRDPGKDAPSLEELLLLPFENIPKMRVREYSLQSYSNQVLRLIRAGKPERGLQKWRINWQK